MRNRRVNDSAVSLARGAWRGRLVTAPVLVALLGSLLSVIAPTPAAAAPRPSWSIVPSPGGGYLFGVSCTSSTLCVAVGSLIESWDGSTWSTVPSPGGANLFGVSCTSPTFCMAVGGGSVPLIEAWNGATWSIVPSPNPVTGGGALQGVTCLTSAFCVAVGHDSNFPYSDTLIESWDGTAWSIVPSPNSQFWNELHGVSCTSSTFCVAVGDGGSFTLIEAWDGTTWSIVPSPNVGEITDYIVNELQGVSCFSSTSCVAVGGDFFVGDQSPTDTLIESWNGTAWSIVPSPNMGTVRNVLRGVSCALAFCMAVGSYSDGAGELTLTAWLVGHRWSIVPSPNVAASNNYLNGVSCTAARLSCMAVGYSSDGTTNQTLIERYV